MSLIIAHEEAANCVALFDERLLLFTRTRLLTKGALDQSEAIVNEHVAKASSARPVGSFVVLPGDAGLSRHDLLERQRRLFERLKREPHVFSAVCVLGSSPQTIAMRAVVRLFLLGRPSMQLFSDTESAARWVARALKLDERAVFDAYRTMVARCDAAPIPLNDQYA